MNLLNFIIKIILIPHNLRARSKSDPVESNRYVIYIPDLSDLGLYSMNFRNFHQILFKFSFVSEIVEKFEKILDELVTIQGGIK